MLFFWMDPIDMLQYFTSVSRRKGAEEALSSVPDKVMLLVTYQTLLGVGPKWAMHTFQGANFLPPPEWMFSDKILKKMF